MKLIDKDALVAEIERRKDEEVDYDEGSKNFASYADQIHYSTLDSIENFINTLEVKEVDIDEAARKWEDKVYLEKGWQDKYGIPHIPFSEIGNAFIAGFEFGTKTIKGE